MKTRKKRLIFEIGSIIAVVLVCGISFLCDVSFLKIPNIFILRIENQEDLFFNLFSVQATVASVGIAIIALLSGMNTESVHGICISRFIAHIKPIFLKHDRLITMNIVLTALNYFIVSYGFFNLSIAVFFVSIIITIVLVRETYVVFMGRHAIRHQIKQYVIENYNEDILKDIGISLNDIEHLKNLTLTREELEIIEAIFKDKVSNLTENKANEIKEIESLIIDSCINILKKNDPQLTILILNHIHEIYIIANEGKTKIPLKIWDSIIREYFGALKCLSYQQLNDSEVFYGIYKNLYHNQKLAEGNNRYVFLNANELKYYSAWMYNTLAKNQSNDLIDMKRVTSILYNNIFGLYRFDNEILDEQKTLLMSEACTLAKCMVDSGDVQNISNLFFDIWYNTEKHKTIPLVVVLIYLYYLACREPLANAETEKLYAEKIIKKNVGIIKAFLEEIDIVKVTRENISFIRDLMRMWELMPEKEAKTIILDGVIDDFLIFSALNKAWTKDEIMHVLCDVSPNNTFSIYSTYFSGKTSYAKDMYTQFRQVLLNKDDGVDEQIDLLRNVLYDKYKAEELREGKEEPITKETEINFAKCINEEIEAIIKSNPKISDSHEMLPDEAVTKEIPVLIMQLPNSIINRAALYDGLGKEIRDAIIRQFLYTIREHLKIATVSAYDNNIQEKFIQMVNESNISGDLYIGNRDVFWREENKNLLAGFISGMEKITHQQGYSQIFIVERKAFYFSISDFMIEFEDLTDSEIERDCKFDEDGRLLYKVTNDIYIPFEKTELTEHIHRIIKKVKISAKVTYKLNGIVGAGMNIELKSK